jgi:hypothetical protein
LTTDRRDFLRRVMLTAWDFHRAEPGRAFGDCLHGAWNVIRALRQAGRALMRAKGRARVLQLSPMLYRSPTANRAGSDRYAAFKCAYTTAQLGR